MRNFLNINALDRGDVLKLVQRALALKAGATPKQAPFTVANLFFENSTRTHTSFQMAENKLGYHQIVLDPQTSSMSKGESLADTLKTLKAIGIDVAVVRHAINDWYVPVLEAAGHPIPQLVNAGDGSGQHPSQSLLDLVKAGTLPERLKLTVIFAPTGPLQETSMSSGWAETYLKIAERFDQVEALLW